MLLICRRGSRDSRNGRGYADHGALRGTESGEIAQQVLKTPTLARNGDEGISRSRTVSVDHPQRVRVK